MQKNISTHLNLDKIDFSSPVGGKIKWPFIFK